MIRVTPKIRDTPITVLLIHTTPVKPLSLHFSPARVQTALRCTLLPAPDALLRLRAAAASCGRSLGDPPSLAWTDASMQRSPATRKRARSEEDEVFPSATSSSGCALRDHAAGRSPDLRRALSALLPRPRVVRPNDKSSMLRVFGACGGDAAAAAQAISSRRGFEGVTARDLQRWAAAAASPRATIGRPVCAAFEAQVLALLVLEGNLKVVNTVYSYEVVRIAARAVQAAPQWAGHPLVSRLAFSNMWVRGWLCRAGLRRLRVTCVEKVVPPAEVIAARMRAIQERIVSCGFQPRDVRSADETGVWFGATPRYQYVGAGVRRGSAPPSDDRARFTAHLNGSADGTMHPPFLIVRCSVVGRDLSGTRVLQGLHDAHGFGEAAEWSLREWRCVLTTLERGGKA